MPMPNPAPLRPNPNAHERAWHEGTVREVRPGVWRAWRARERKPDGTTTRPSRTFHGPQAGQRAALWAKGDVEPDVLLLGHWLDRWLAMRWPLIRPQTRRNYQRCVDACAPIADLPLATLTVDRLQVHANAMLSRWARSSVNVWRATISSALLTAVPTHLAANPMAGVRLPKPEERPVKAWKADEVAKLIEAARGRAHETWLLLSLGTGIRLGESRALLWSDVNLTQLTITVSKSLDHDTDQVGPTKSGKIRVVDLPDELVPVLVEHRARQSTSEQRVCVSTFSRRMPDPKTIQSWLRRLAMDAGVRPLSPHSARHTYATIALDHGVPLKEVSEQLGHADVAITAAIYTHNVGIRSRRAAAAVGAVLALKPSEGTRNDTRDAG